MILLYIFLGGIAYLAVGTIIAGIYLQIFPEDFNKYAPAWPLIVMFWGLMLIVSPIFIALFFVILLVEYCVKKIAGIEEKQ